MNIIFSCKQFRYQKLILTISVSLKGFEEENDYFLYFVHTYSDYIFER